MKGCICHFTKWQIHPIISEGTVSSAPPPIKPWWDLSTWPVRRHCVYLRLTVLTRRERYTVVARKIATYDEIKRPIKCTYNMLKHFIYVGMECWRAREKALLLTRVIAQFVIEAAHDTISMIQIQYKTWATGMLADWLTDWLTHSDARGWPWVNRTRRTWSVFSDKLRCIVGLRLVEMAISTNPKPTMHRNWYENTGPGTRQCI